MNFCPNCGAKRTQKANFCSNCGFAFNQNVESPSQVNNNVNVVGAGMGGNLLGTLVTLQLMNGLTQNAYERNGNYYSDPNCRRKINPATIMGVMGQPTDNIIDVMSLNGQRADFGTIMHNNMAKSMMNRSHNRTHKGIL